MHGAVEETLAFAKSHQHNLSSTRSPVVAQRSRGGGSGVVVPGAGRRADNTSASVNPNHLEQAWGIPFDPDEFVTAAVKAGHPHKLGSLLPNMQKPIHELREIRVNWFKRWVNRAAELAKEEEKLKKTMDEHTSRILAPKRLLLWKEMLQEAGYSDLGVFDEVSQGTVLAGEVAQTGVFEQKFKPADLQHQSWRSFRKGTERFMYLFMFVLRGYFIFVPTFHFGSSWTFISCDEFNFFCRALFYVQLSALAFTITALHSTFTSLGVKPNMCHFLNNRPFPARRAAWTQSGPGYNQV